MNTLAANPPVWWTCRLFFHNHANSQASTVSPHLLWNTHMDMKRMTHRRTHMRTYTLSPHPLTHTHMHWDVVIGRAGISWEYESGSMTSLLFTGIRSSLTLTFPIYTLPPPPPICLSNHIDAVQQVTRLVMSKAHLTTYFLYGGDLIHVTESFELKSSAQSSLFLLSSFYWMFCRQCNSDIAFTLHNEGPHF